jgi:small basic protein (TIGR04137 family)
MSIHPSLRGADTLVGERSVFTRVERLQKLIRDGKMTEEDSVYGLPKVRTKFKIKGKKKDKEEEGGATDEGEAAEESAES